MNDENKNWICTDPDCAQYRRQAPEHGHNVFELAQVNQYGAGLFRVAHGFVYLDNDLDGHERDLLCELYDWDTEIINSPDFNAILAEVVFETSAALRTAAPYLNAEQRQRVCQAANNCIEQHRRTIHTAELAALIAQRDALTA